MTFYARRSDNAYCAFEGMSQDVINAMLAEQGLSCEYVTQEVYQAAIRG